MLSSCFERGYDEDVLNEILAKYDHNSSNLIAVLQDLQDHYGYLPKNALLYIAKDLRIHPAEVYGVATFYAQFRMTPVGKYHLVVCQGTACHVNGADNIIRAIEDELGSPLGSTTPDGLFTLESVACLGCCSLAPVMKVNEKVYGSLTPNKARKIVKDIREQIENSCTADHAEQKALAD